MRFKLFRENGALNSVPVFDAFAKSLSKHACIEHDDYDVAVIWSILWNGRMSKNKAIWDHCQKNNIPVIVLEVGGIKRNATWKVGINGINREAYFGEKGKPDDRAKKFGLELKPWQTGRDIIICCQNPHSHQWRNMPPASTWVYNTVDTIRKYTAKPIIIREHPRSRLDWIEIEFINVTRQTPIKIDGSYDDFDFDFHNAHAVVNWSSNPATQAVIGGVPVFVGPESLAWDVGNQDLTTINNPIKPDRTQWLNDLAYTEWTQEEIQNGEPLLQLLPKLQELVLAKK